jgi:xylose isomerase-like TIM barrel protein
VRLINDIGPDITGVTLDTGNLPLSGDVPADAIARLAPYVHMTHVKDGILYRTKEGLVQQLRPVGQGIVDWEQALAILHRYEPDLHLSFEDYRAENLIRFYDDRWRRHFPELTDDDITKFEQLADQCAQRIEVGELSNVEDFNKLPFTDADRLVSYKRGARYLRNFTERK